LSDARVLQTSQRLRFLAEPTQSIGGGQAELDHFQSDNAAWFFLLSFVDSAHATFAEQPNNAIAANGRWVGMCAWLERRCQIPGRHLYCGRVQEALRALGLCQERFDFAS
jgi:hypothetical protein